MQSPASPARNTRSAAAPGAPRKEYAAARPRKLSAARRELFPATTRRESKAALLAQVMAMARRLDAENDLGRLTLELADEKGRTLRFSLSGEVRDSDSESD